MATYEAWKRANEVGSIYNIFLEEFRRCMNLFKSAIEQNQTQVPTLDNIEVIGATTTLGFAGEEFLFQLSIARQPNQQYVGIIELLRKPRTFEGVTGGSEWILCESISFDRTLQTTLQDGEGNTLRLSDDAAVNGVWLAWLAQAVVERAPA